MDLTGGHCSEDDDRPGTQEEGLPVGGPFHLQKPVTNLLFNGICCLFSLKSDLYLQNNKLFPSSCSLGKVKGDLTCIEEFIPGSGGAFL